MIDETGELVDCLVACCGVLGVQKKGGYLGL